MSKREYDLIIVGGGLGGSALAKVMAGEGARVLVAEREVQFKDRIRGEWMAPWGVAEAQRIGIYDLLLDKCACEQPYFKTFAPESIRDFRATTAQSLPSLTFYHPSMQELVLGAAESAGAEVRRGVTVRDVKPGEPPVATIEANGVVRELTAHMVVCADGRSSAGRAWLGLSPKRAKPRYLGAGIMFENMPIAEDISLIVINPSLGRMALLFPQGHGRVRGYLVYPPEQISRLQGEADFARFVDECVSSGMPRECYADAQAQGPLASFDMTENWVEHPYSAGVALIGDAAGASDPTWGQGLSLTTRDVRVLAETLIASKDWNAAGHAYAEAHDKYFATSVKVGDWLFQLFLAQGAEADAVRARAMPLIANEPERVPDHNASGPDLPCDESVKRRFFGEE